MNELDRTIGMLVEQGKWTAKKLDAIEQNSMKMNEKIDSLLAFKWKSLGALAFFTFLVSSIIEIARAFN